MRNTLNVKKFSLSFVKYFLVIVIIIFFGFPFYWTVSLSFKTRLQAMDPSAWLFEPTLQNYIYLFTKWNLGKYFLNSLIVTIATIFLSLALSLPAAYSLARFNFKGKESLAFWILSLRMLPAMSAVIPFYVIADLLHLLDTQIILIIAYLTFNIPFSIWLLRDFISGIPIDLEEAALIDGCSRFSAFVRVVLPLATPGLVVTAVFCFIQSWNEFAFALFLTGMEAKTLPPAITFFMTSVGVKWGELAATASIITIPVIVFAWMTQRYLVRGLTFGAVKGVR